jgi:hypothetical protein
MTARTHNRFAARTFSSRRVMAKHTRAYRIGGPLRGREENLMSFMLYIVGIIVLISGLIYGAYLLNVPQQWVVVGAVIVAGLGILSGVARTRSKDKSE